MADDLLPPALTPMAATVSDRRSLGAGWVFERKLDGYRCLARVEGGSATLRSRNGLDFADRFPEVAADLPACVRGACVLDGEVVATVGDRSSFSLLHQRAPEVELRYVVFDLLWFDGHDLRPLDLAARIDALRQVVVPGGVVQVAEQIEGEAGELLDAACGLGWEGLIAKRSAAPYQARRSRDWLKLKCRHEQEFVVGGFTEPSGSRSGFGALLVGVHDADGALRYAGKVGTGFDEAELRSLDERVRAREQPERPFADVVRERGARWVRPELVVQVAFGEWTESAKLRHPRYLGLRVDKDPAEVVREP